MIARRLASRRGRALALGAGCAAVILMLSACTAGPNELIGADGPQSAGFLLGLWHGMIAPITFIVSLFTSDVTIFEVRNSGGWYSFGFLLGASISLSGAAGGSYAGSRRRSSRRGR